MLRSTLRFPKSKVSSTYVCQVTGIHSHRDVSTSIRAASKKKTQGETCVEQASIDSARNNNTTKKKTTTQLDEDMRRAMEGLAGDGGEAGLELENGKAVSMKRSVRENMFRYI